MAMWYSPSWMCDSLYVGLVEIIPQVDISTREKQFNQGAEI